MSEKIYCHGHRNPDTDSICSAVAYARLKNRIGMDNVVPARLGDANSETSWVFDYWELDLPEFLADVKLRARDFMDKNLLIVDKNETIRDVRNKINQSEASNAFVCRHDNRVTGLVTLGDLGDYCLDQLVAGTNGRKLDAEAIVNEKIVNLMRTELVTIDADMEMDKVKATVLEHRFRNFPVVDGTGQIVGSISRQDLISAKPKQIILVDHNEKSQSVLGIDEAEVIEVVDHHKVGDVQTMGPIHFIIEPVGCTSTIISKLYKTHGLTPEPAYAGLMLSAIISDTVLFRSPTCTPEDIKIAEELAAICGVDIQEYGMELLGASSPLTSSTASQVLNTDLKEFVYGDLHIAVGQVMMTDNKKFLERKGELLAEMTTVLNNRELTLVGLMCTNILEETTYLLTVGDDSIPEKAFGKKPVDNEVVLPGVLSRKKQIVPQISKILI